MIVCKACSLEHPSMERCEFARRRLASKPEMVVDTPINVVVDKIAMVVDSPKMPDVVVVDKISRHGKRADMDKRRAYQKEWIAKRRSKS